MKRRKEAERIASRNRRRFMSIAIIVLTYFLIVLALVYITVAFAVPVHLRPRPTPWVYMIIFVYYGLPVLLAFLCGGIFRPFWLNVRNVLFWIVLVHGIYSVVAYSLRYEYRLKRKEDIYKSTVAHLKVESITKEFIDTNKDGIIDVVRFSSMLDAADFPAGTYALVVHCTQERQPLKRGGIQTVTRTLSGSGTRRFKFDFDMPTERFQHYFAYGPLEVNFRLLRDVPLDEEGKRIAAVCRWAAFYRATDWEGIDQQLRDQKILLEEMWEVDTIELLPVRF